MAIDLRGRSSVSFYDTFLAFPSTGSTTTLYVDRGDMVVYIWNGSSYEQLNNGSNITTVANYSELLAIGASNVPNMFYWCSSAQGTSWLPGPLGGTYYNSGLYYSNGTSWEYMNSPYQATQLEVDAGIVSDKFVTPSTFYNSSKWDSIPTDITIGTTPITSGVAGRVLFEGAGNVVQEDSGLFWNNTNKILTTFRSGAGTGPIFRLNVGSSDVSKLQFTQELSVGVPTEIGYISNQFGTGMILNSFNSIYFNANNAEKMRIVSGTGNILINTTTDNGGKLQVKASGALSTDIAFRVRNSADTDDLMLVNGLGNVGIGTNAPNSRLHLSGSTTTSSAIARGGNITPTLVASANNDILVGLDIAPTFTNGAFTGVTNTALRLIFSGTGTGVGNYLSFTNIAGYPTINSGGQISINAQNSTVFYADAGSTSIFGRSLSSNINFQLSNTIIGRFFNTTGNLLLQNGGTFTDNGYKLDVNGTQRVQGLSSLNSVVINNTVLNASAVLQADSTIQGFLPPRMTTTQKNAIATPAAGLIVYDTTTNKACCYNGTSWNDLF